MCLNETTDSVAQEDVTQVLKCQEPANAGSCNAERGGFEPPVHFHAHSISSAAQSTTLPPLRFPFPNSTASSLRSQKPEARSKENPGIAAL